ncbi:hypothetical protein Q5O89_00120 [Peribacillus frigoritolerans]|nr:hypothetical protein [Peribacillus frigoritolerans]
MEGCTDSDTPSYNWLDALFAEALRSVGGKGADFRNQDSVLLGASVPHSIYLFEQDKTANKLPLYSKLPTKKVT